RIGGGESRIEEARDAAVEGCGAGEVDLAVVGAGDSRLRPGEVREVRPVGSAEIELERGVRLLSVTAGRQRGSLIDVERATVVDDEGANVVGAKAAAGRVAFERCAHERHAAV